MERCYKLDETFRSEPFEQSFRSLVLPIPNSWGRDILQVSKRARNGRPTDINPGTSSSGVSILMVRANNCDFTSREYLQEFERVQDHSRIPLVLPSRRQNLLHHHRLLHSPGNPFL